jgi:hypothetical protein
MKRYTIAYRYVIFDYVEVEAKSLEEAKELAFDITYPSHEYITQCASFEIDEQETQAINENI